MPRKGNKPINKPKPKDSPAKGYGRGNKNMSAKQQYKLNRQANRYTYKENTAKLKADVAKTTVRGGAATAGATSGADSLKEGMRTKDQSNQDVYIFDSAAQGFLPSTDDAGQIIQEGTKQGSTTKTTSGGLQSSL